MAEDPAVDPSEVRKVAERALQLQSYRLRRAWGVLYAALSMAMYVTIFLSRIVARVGLPGEAALLLQLGLNMLASGTAIIVIIRTFGRVRDTAEIRHAIADLRWSTPFGYRVLLPTWVTIYVVLVATAIFFPQLVPFALLVAYAVLAAYMYYSLALSFPSKRPVEATLALSSLVIAISVSIGLLTFLVSEHTPYSILWALNVAIWLIAAAYALTRPMPKSLEVYST